ncbi:hypothetical protein SEA_SQUIDDLY_105 [Gordonia phage Squiddly]|nr:hypothetical protein SEA_SQUIDDLY_105 [Gordonia phage Squiddly]
MTEPEPVEPCAVWRMLTNDWPRDKVATLLHMSQAQILKAEQLQNVALRGIDPKLIADPMLRLMPPPTDR